MQLSLKWLNSLLSINSFKNIDHTNLEKYLINENFNPNILTLTGFEVEEISSDKKNNDILLEIDTTPNRSDVTSIIGIGREISTLMNISERHNSSYTKITNNLRHTIFKANNEVGVSNVPVFCYAEIHNVNVNESPNWLKTRLRQNNLEPDNLFTDLTNYSLIEWGQPINFYDLDKISDAISKQELNIK